MERLNRMWVEDDEDNAPSDENEHERREELFGWVIGCRLLPTVMLILLQCSQVN